MAKMILVIDDGRGIMLKSGTCVDGTSWIEWERDAFAGETKGICTECDAVLESGWLCLDDSEVVCDSHVQFISTPAETE